MEGLNFDNLRNSLDNFSLQLHFIKREVYPSHKSHQNLGNQLSKIDSLWCCLKFQGGEEEKGEQGGNETNAIDSALFQTGGAPMRE